MNSFFQKSNRLAHFDFPSHLDDTLLEVKTTTSKAL